MLDDPSYSHSIDGPAHFVITCEIDYYMGSSGGMLSATGLETTISRVLAQNCNLATRDGGVKVTRIVQVREESTLFEEGK